MHALILSCTVLAITAIVGITFFALRPRRDSYVEQLQTLAAKLPTGRLESIANLREDDAREQDVTFWNVSGRLRGVIERLRALEVLVQLLQRRRADRPDLNERVREVWRILAVQAFFSLLAFPEALLCKMWGDIPHAAARIAASCHVSATYKTQDVCFSEDTPECIGNLY